MVKTIYTIKRKDGSWTSLGGKYDSKKQAVQALSYLTYPDKEEHTIVKEKIKEENKHIIYSSYIDSDTFAEEKKAMFRLLMEMSVLTKRGSYLVTDNFGKEVELTKEEYDNYVESVVTDSVIWERCYENNLIWYEDAEYELKRADTGRDIIAIASLGLWNGRKTGYKEFNGLENVLNGNNCDNIEVYVNSNGDIIQEGTHHDGSNRVLFRYWKEGLTERQKKDFRNKLYYGKATRKDITRYTSRAGVEIAKVYGWSVRGA